MVKRMEKAWYLVKTDRNYSKESLKMTIIGMEKVPFRTKMVTECSKENTDKALSLGNVLNTTQMGKRVLKGSCMMEDQMGKVESFMKMGK